MDEKVKVKKKKNRNKQAYKNFDRDGQKKLTWRTFYKDFRQYFPDLSQTVKRWEPYDYFNIKLYFRDGNKGLYNIDTHSVKMLPPDDIKPDMTQLGIAAKGR